MTRKKASPRLAFDLNPKKLAVVASFPLKPVNFAIIAFNGRFQVLAFIGIESPAELFAIVAVVTLQFVDLTLQGQFVMIVGLDVVVWRRNGDRLDVVGWRNGGRLDVVRWRRNGGRLDVVRRRRNGNRLDVVWRRNGCRRTAI